jgi:hypothetical protein
VKRRNFVAGLLIPGEYFVRKEGRDSKVEDHDEEAHRKVDYIDHSLERGIFQSNKGSD